MIEEGAKTVQRLALYRPCSATTRIDTLGFGIAYVGASMGYVATGSVLWSIAIPTLMFLHGILLLMCYWSVSLRASIRFKLQTKLANATHVLAVAAPHCGQSELCLLMHQDVGGDKVTYFNFQKTKFVYYPDRHEFGAVDLPLSHSLSTYSASTGLTSSAVDNCKLKYGPNSFDIPLPTFVELFEEHAMAPFFVFQVFCVCLWCLDEYWYYSLVTLAMLLVFEAMLVKRRLRNLEDLREMRVPPYMVYAYRNSKWAETMSNELYPGDLVSLTRTNNHLVVPCDVLLISGSCVVDEALLTGESVPQIKESVSELDQQITLDVKKEHRRNMVFGGTKILVHNQATSPFQYVRGPPNGGCTAYVLSTGFNTTQGRLMRTILFSTEHVTVNNKESLFFILFLLVFAVLAAAYVLTKGLQNETRSRYKLMLNCIMIVTSVVPPELPMELSLAVNSSLIALAKDKIFCTEPFRIPMAGAVDVCCFDKTGTITADDFKVKGVAGIQGKSSTVWGDNLPDEVKIIIAGCHSLTNIPGGLVGDPLEKAAFHALHLTLTHGDTVTSRSGVLKIRILHRHPFSSTLKRMSCFIEAEGQHVRVVCKGAPEMMADRFKPLPANYDRLHQFYSQQGYRVLALGYKDCGRKSQEDRKTLKRLSRDEVESDLTFAGFLVLGSPMKPDSYFAVRALLLSSHKVVMITGDHMLTACAVARETNIIIHPPLILTPSEEGGCVWVSLDGKQTKPFDVKLGKRGLELLSKDHSLCVSGPALDHLSTTLQVGTKELAMLALHTCVFARTSPDHKEAILTWLKTLGKTTLMCGDGTNDVGALKQAHVGVALIGETRPTHGEEDTHMMNNAAQFNVTSPSTITHRKSGNSFTVLPSPTNPNTPGAKGKPKSPFDSEEGVGVRLGDASIAAPFTSKVPYITSTVNIIRQGRCTLVTTMQMFHILALNCLISAYSMSVLYLDGVKLGDTQMTIAGMSVAMFFFFISRSKPLKELSPERPHSKLFTPAMLLSVMGQFAIHMVVLMLAVADSHPHTPSDGDSKDPDGEFRPNVLNTAVYIITTTMTVTTFLANYRGRPFMEGLLENKQLMYSLVGTLAMMAICTLELMPPANAFLELHPLPNDQFRMKLVLLMCMDVAGAVAYARLVAWVFAIKPKPPIIPPRSQLDSDKLLEAEAIVEAAAGSHSTGAYTAGTLGELLKEEQS